MAMIGNQTLNNDGPILTIPSNFPCSANGDPSHMEKGSPSGSISDGSTTPTSLESGEVAETTRSKARTFVIMVAVYLAVFASVLDTVSLPTALPTITVALDTSDSGFAWIGATHMISGAASVAFWGKISNIFGRRNIMLFAKTMFLVGSLVSATCTGIQYLFLGRVIQGMSGAGIVALANLVIDDLFGKQGSGFYLSLIAATWSFAIAISPVVGGYFADTIGWRWCFWINLPIVGLSFLLFSPLMKSHHPRVSVLAGLKKVDWLGTLAIASSVILFLIGVEFGGVRFAWHSPVIICLLVFSLVAFIVFILIEWRVAEQPLFPRALFTQRSTIAALVICATHGMAFQSHLYFMPPYFQAVLGVSQSRSGLGSLIMTGMLAITNVAVGLYITKRGGHLTIMRIGAVILTLGVGLMIDLQPHKDRPRVISYQLIIGIGLGMLFQPALITLQKHLKGEHVAAGSSAFLFLRPLSYGISAVVGQLLLQTQLKERYSDMINVGISPDIAGAFAFEDTVRGTPLIRGLEGDQRAVVKHAIADGLETVWIFYTAIAFIALIASWCIAGPERSGDEEKVASSNKPRTDAEKEGSKDAKQ